MVHTLRFNIFLLFISSSLFSQNNPDQIYNQAYESYLKEDLKEAYHYISQYLDQRKDAEGFYLKALIQEKSNDMFGAIESLTASIEFDESFREAYFKRGEIYLKKNYFELAIDDFTYLISLGDGGNTNAIFFQLDVSGQQQVKVSSLENMKSKMYTLRAKAFYETGDFDRAFEDFEQAIRLDSSAEQFVDRAVLFMKVNRERDARQDLKMAIHLDSTNTLAWYNLLLIDPDTNIPDDVLRKNDFGPLLGYRAIEAFQENNIDQAGNLFRYALEVNPEDPLVLINYGRYLIKTNEQDNARKNLRKAYDLEPHRIECLYLIGNSYFKDSRYEEAIAWYESYLARDGSNASVWYNAAVTYRQLGNSYDSCRCLKNARQRGAKIEKGSSIWNVCE